MNFNIYNVLEIGVPVVALILFLWIDNVVDFLKNHWEKARRFIVFLILNIPLAASSVVCVSRIFESLASGNISKSIAIELWLTFVVMLWLYIRINFLDEQLDKGQRRNAKMLSPDIAGTLVQSSKQALRDYLEEPVNDFPWLRVYTEEENRRGLLALRELAQRIRTRRGQLLHCGYLFHIFTAQKALGMGQYSLACHELFDVVHFYQSSEVTALIYKMLEPYLNEVTPMEQAAKSTCCPHCGNPCHAEDRYCRFCGERLFKRFSELPEDLQKIVIEQTERSIDLYLQS